MENVENLLQHTKLRYNKLHWANGTQIDFHHFQLNVLKNKNNAAPLCYLLSIIVIMANQVLERVLQRNCNYPLLEVEWCQLWVVKLVAFSCLFFYMMIQDDAHTVHDRQNVLSLFVPTTSQFFLKLLQPKAKWTMILYVPLACALNVKQKQVKEEVFWRCHTCFWGQGYERKGAVVAPSVVRSVLVLAWSWWPSPPASLESWCPSA